MFPDKYDWHGCSAVEFNPEKMSGAATVGPVRLHADTVLECFLDGDSIDQIIETYGMDEPWARQAMETIIAFAKERGYTSNDAG